MEKITPEEVTRMFNEVDGTVEQAAVLQKSIDTRLPKAKPGYTDLFNLTVRPIRTLTFPYYGQPPKHRERLHSYQALTSFLFVENDFDYVQIVQGLEGIGKSTYAMKIIDDLRRLGKEYDMSRHMITKSWEYKDVENLLEEETNSIIYFDEGKKFFDLRRSMRPERIDMLEFFTTERWRRNIYILAVSDLTEIDKYFRERRAKSITLLPDRGLAYMLHSINLFGVGTDRFYLERFENIINSQKGFHFGRQLSLLMNLPTCYGVGFTKSLPEDERWKEYFRLKTERGEKAEKRMKDYAQKKLEAG